MSMKFALWARQSKRVGSVHFMMVFVCRAFLACCCVFFFLLHCSIADIDQSDASFIVCAKKSEGDPITVTSEEKMCDSLLYIPSQNHTIIVAFRRASLYVDLYFWEWNTASLRRETYNWSTSVAVLHSTCQ